MKSIAFVLLLSGTAMFSQDLPDSAAAPAPVDQALRARVDRFYKAYVAGKFRDAYEMVAQDSQDAFMLSDKGTYKGCETLKISYSENFTVAQVLAICQGEVRFHGDRFETKIPLTTFWKTVNNEWYWGYVKPTRAQTPFSPTGWVDLPKDDPDEKLKGLPKDPVAEARSILAKVKLDKSEIHLQSFETSKDVLHVKNDMEGYVTVTVDKVTQPGVKVTIAKADLGAHQETVVTFEYLLDDATITCGDCAKRVKGTLTTNLRIFPTNQVFPVNIVFGIPAEAEQQIPEEIRKKKK